VHDTACFRLARSHPRRNQPRIQVAPVSYAHCICRMPNGRSGWNGKPGSRRIVHILYTGSCQRAWSGLQGLQFNYQTPRTYSATSPSNTRSPTACPRRPPMSLQWAGSSGGTGPTTSRRSSVRNSTTQVEFVRQATYRHGAVSRTLGAAQLPGQRRHSHIPRPATKIEQQFSNGMTFLVTYHTSRRRCLTPVLAQRRQQRRLARTLRPWAWSQVRLGSGGLQHPAGVPLQRRL